jgi:HK97 family phage prohead protease
MAYDILAKDGRPVLKDGDQIKAMDIPVSKIEQLDEKTKTFIAIASTEDEDRDKDIIRQDGWNLKNFKKNPMIPWSHNYWGVPIARSLRTWVDHESKRLLFKPQFDENDEESLKIFNKYKNGFLTSFSVGFRGIEFAFRDEEDKWGGGTEFTKQELLEISGVTIPANPNATVSFHGETECQNMLQMGFPTKFAKTEGGLFYPVREELAEFVNPEIKDFHPDCPGVQAVYANSISSIGSDGSFTEDPIPVGFYFDPEIYNTGDVKGWINDNTDNTYKLHYYDWKWIKDKQDFKIEEKEVEKEVPHFDNPIKVMTSEDVASDGETSPEIYNTDDEIVDVEKMMKDFLLELNDTLEKHLDGISKGVETALEKFLEGVTEIKLLLSEKTVDSNSEIDDNISDTDINGSDDDNNQDSKSDDEIEIDDSLLSPDGNDKSNSDDVIELDDDMLSNKDTVNAAVKSGLSEKLKETLKEVKDAFKIEV